MGGQGPTAKADELSMTEGIIVDGPAEVKGHSIGGLNQWFTIGGDSSIITDADAPNGNYNVQWSINCSADVRAMTVSCELFKNNLNQSNGIAVSTDGGKQWKTVGGNSADWSWQTIEKDVLMLSKPADGKLHFSWRFSKPETGNIWQVGLRNLKIQSGDEKQAIAHFREPLAKGLPQLADPIIAKKPWKSTLEIKDGMMMKDGQPFFPIGYVFGSDERSLAQLKAMGCNAVHLEIGWQYMTEEGAIDEAAITHFIGQIHNAAEYDIVTFPLLTGHYVPGWFSQKNRPEDYCPLGNDGHKTGDWFEYSIHYKPFRKEIIKFWKSVTPRLAEELSVMAIQYWNEPCYGGNWAKPDEFADYQSFAIKDYQQFLSDKYGSISTLAGVHNQNYTDMASVMPPYNPEQMGRAAWLDWMEYGQHYFAGFFDWEREIIKSVAPNARLCNKKQTNPWDNSTASSGTNWHLMQTSEDIFGLNIYWGSEFGIRDTLDAARSYANGKPVVIFETNVMPPNAEARTPDRIRCHLWSHVLGGADGLFIFALNDDPSHGLLSDKAVSPQARSEYVRYTRTISEHQLQLASPHVPARIAVLYSTTAALQYTRDLIPRYVSGAFDLFRNSHYQTDILPEERCRLEDLAEYEMIVLPSYCILKKPAIEALEVFVNNGGKILAFGKSLATDEYLNPVEPPRILGIETRQPPIGERSDQELTWTVPEVVPYSTGEPKISGVERVTQIVNDPDRIIQGIKIEFDQKGKVLGLNRDSYPVILSAPGGNIIYCAFESAYSVPLRGVIEGITRECLGIEQKIRLLRDGVIEPDVMVSLREDYKNPSRRYLLVINTLYRQRTLEVELQPQWEIEREDFHGLDKLQFSSDLSHPSVSLLPREVFLFELVKK